MSFQSFRGQTLRDAKRILAREATALIHGQNAAVEAEEGARKMFEGGASANAPSIEVALPILVIDALLEGQLAQSKGAARRLIQQGGVRLNADKVQSIEASIDDEITLWAGKKRAVQIRRKG